MTRVSITANLLRRLATLTTSAWTRLQRQNRRRGSRVYLLKQSPHRTLAGERITAKLNKAPGNHAPIGGVKVITVNGWFAARPSGTESIYKIYAESFKDRAHLDAILREAQEIVNKALEVKS